MIYGISWESLEIYLEKYLSARNRKGEQIWINVPVIIAVNFHHIFTITPTQSRFGVKSTFLRVSTVWQLNTFCGPEYHLIWGKSIKFKKRHWRYWSVYQLGGIAPHFPDRQMLLYSIKAWGITLKVLPNKLQNTFH